MGVYGTQDAMCDAAHAALLLAGFEHHVSGRNDTFHTAAGKVNADPGDTGSAGVPTERVQFSRLAPGPSLALLATIGEVHGPGPGGEAEADLAAGAEKSMHISESGAGLEEFLTAGERHREARHAARLRGFADARALGDLLSALAATALGGQLGCTRADLADVPFVRRHGGDGGALGRLQLPTEQVEALVAQLTKRVRFDPVAERGKLHPCALYSQFQPASRRVRIHLLYDARSRHRIEGGTARGSGSP